MATSTTSMVDRLKAAAARVGTQGVRVVIDALVSAADEVDKLQEAWAKQQRVGRGKRAPAHGALTAEQQAEMEPDLYRPIPDRPVRRRPARVPPEEVRSTAELVREEAHAVEERIKGARPARRPLKVPGVEEEAPATPKRRASPASKLPRTSGRKTTATATAPRRVKAKEGGFKAKRGQKHRH